MFEVKISSDDFARMTRKMDAAYSQMPFAMSRALNDAAKEAYDYIISDTWPTHVTVRNSSFLRYFLRTNFSDKANLRVEIYDSSPDQRGHLALHADGGTKEPKGSAFTIPTANVPRTGHGVREGLRARNLPRKVVKGNRIFQEYGPKRSRKLKLMYVLAKRVVQPKDVPFREDFATTITAAAHKHFPERMRQAMRTAR